MKKLIILCFLTAFFGICYSQEFPEKDKKYDLQIYEFLDSLTNQTSIDTFLINSKPFSKWDIRPISKERIWVFDTIYTAGEIPNFIWGAFANKYKISKKDGMDYPNRFLNHGIESSSAFIKNLKVNLTKFEDLTQKVLSSNNHFFVNQNSLLRIDEVYREENQYWKYIIPFDSPFPMSNKIDVSIDITFSDDQILILDLLKELSIYAAVKTSKGIFYLIDGFTDNSYGFYYSQEGKMEMDNFLFHIMTSERINAEYFYYVAN